MFTLNSKITITDPTGTNYLEFPFVIEAIIKSLMLRHRRLIEALVWKFPA